MKYCDLVMKGGITSGVIYPRAVVELARKYHFKNIGGTSAGAIAAAATATEPFTWADVQERQPGASARIFAAARAFGWTDGLLVPVPVTAEAEPTRLGVVSLAAPTLGGLTALAGSLLPAWSARSVKVSEVFSKIS